jgi:hypothetical protein
MKILLSTLFLLTFIHAKGISLLLPHQYDTAMHFLKEQLKTAKDQVTLITPHLQSSSLEKILILLNSKNIHITLITSSAEHMGSSLVQYKNIDFYQIEDKKFTFTLLSIDTKITCKLSTSLDKEVMKSEFSLFECSTTKYSLKSATKVIQKIQMYASPYLKEDF